MRIAVTYDNGQVFQHFGHTQQFKLYDVENNTVVRQTVLTTGGSGHGALAGFLQQLQVNALICGGIGPGARNALADCGILLMAGVIGSADDAVAAFLNGTLVHTDASTCDHHEHGRHHGEDHSCGGHHGEDHSCGGHGCH